MALARSRAGFAITGGQARRNWRTTMRQTVLAGTFMCLAAGAGGPAAIPLSPYPDARGLLHVQLQPGAQLADTYQEDADALTAWYSGWYTGLARKHHAN